MAFVKLKQLSAEPLIASDGNPYIQLTGLGEDGCVYVYTPTGRWSPISMEIQTVDDQAKATGIEIVQ